MKIQILIATLSAFFLTSVAFADPAAFQPVDDMTTSTMQSPSNTDTNGNNSPSSSSNTGTVPDSSSTPSPSNDVSPDTATGDDDY